MRLEGLTCLVTGASRGIGAETAKAIVNAGGKVIVHASGESPAMTALAADLSLSEEQLVFEDLSQPGAGARLVEQAVNATSKSGGLDGIVNNAGVFLESPLTLEKTANGDGEDPWVTGWATTLAVNLQAPADICRSAVAYFRERAREASSEINGRIVNIASRAGHRGDGIDHAAYAASKGGLLALTKTYARALSQEGILFYAIAPGWVETRMAPEDIAKRAKAADSEIPLRRVAQPGEVGALAAFLLSDACPSVVGATLDVNGASYVR